MKNTWRHSLVSQILILFIIFNSISITVFTFYVIQQDRKATLENTKESLEKIVSEKAQLISLTMSHIEDETENLAMWTEEYLNNLKDEKLSDEYAFNKDGVLYKKVSTKIEYTDYVVNNSAVFFPADIQLTGEVAAMVNESEHLDIQFKRIMNNIPYLTWAAIPMGNGFLRIYPFTEMNMFTPTHMQIDDPFYKTCIEDNPNGKTRWSKPYLDLMGKGWVMTCTHPIYIDGKIEGVACLDVSLNTIKKDFLADFGLGTSGFAYMLDDSGQVFYHPQVEPTSNTRGDIFLTNIITDTNLDANYKTALKKVLDEKKGIISYNLKNDDRKKLIAYASIEGLPWKVAVEIDQNEFLASNKWNITAFLFFMSTLILILLCFAAYLYSCYSKPILHLVNRAGRISKGDYTADESSFYYTEISNLSQAFNHMSESIRINTGELIHKNNEIETIFNSIGGLLMILNTSCDILLVNENCLETIGISKDRLIGSKCYNVIADSCENCRDCKINQVIEKRIAENATVAIKEDIYDVSYYPIIDGSNNLTEIIVYSRKITDRILLEKELSQAEKMASIGQLSSAVAHELKSPLAVIKGAAYLLKKYTEPYDNNTIMEKLGIISATIASAENVIYNLLDFSSISKGEDVDIDLDNLVKQIIFITQKESTRINIRIETDFEPVPFIFHGKLEPMKQVMINLFTNAFTALKCGGILCITGRRIHKPNGAETLIITIKDSGPGIPDKIGDKIFDPFFTTAANGEGTGLGLWITKIIIERMKGQILIDSKENAGTIVSLILPIETPAKDMKPHAQL